MINKILIISCATILFSCNENTRKKNIVLPKNKENIENSNIKNNLPYSSEQVKKIYRYDKETSEYSININEKDLLEFNQNEVGLSIKENDFDISPKANTKYFNIETFNFPNKAYCKLITYNTYGENDINIVNIQLNSYKNDKLIDQLLLDCRFTFEIEYYRTFVINKDKTIKLTKYSVNNIKINENGDIVGKKTKPEITETVLNYKIDNDGKFIKL